MSTLRIAAALGITAAALVSTTTASPSEARLPKVTTCPILTASQWVLPYAPYTKGTRYDVILHGTAVSCKQAEGYIAKLVTEPVANSVVTAGPRPTGWRCTASASKTGHAYTGTCKPASSTFNFSGPDFTWTVG